MIGVNGVGKTTSIAKIAYRYQSQGLKVMLAAGDTFRAGATEQLEVWAQGSNVRLSPANQLKIPQRRLRSCPGRQKGSIDLLIVDTAGRLQTKMNLMAELVKYLAFSLRNSGAPHETFLIIDATPDKTAYCRRRLLRKRRRLPALSSRKWMEHPKVGLSSPFAMS
jgi:fused signal recognition particle receptor